MAITLATNATNVLAQKMAVNTYRNIQKNVSYNSDSLMETTSYNEAPSREANIEDRYIQAEKTMAAIKNVEKSGSMFAALAMLNAESAGTVAYGGAESAGTVARAGSYSGSSSSGASSSSSSCSAVA